MTTCYLHGCAVRPDGAKDSFWTQGAASKSTAYGQKVLFNGRWRRVILNSISGMPCLKTKPDEIITVTSGN